MSFEFIGERSPELDELDSVERRKRYLVAAKRSYLYFNTWIGLALFLLLLIEAKTIANAIYFVLDKNLFDEKHTTETVHVLIVLAAWFCLGGFQVSSIRKELKKEQKSPNKVLNRTVDPAGSTSG